MEAQIEQQQRDHQAQVSKLKTDHSDEIEKLKKEHKEEIERLMRDLGMSSESNIAELKEKHAAEI